jgi:UDP:flavonoid glycosyltransferase YjiC (YdhE family)
LFVTVPWPTHYHWLVPLAWALRVQGHDARVACQASLLDAVAGSGLPAVRIGRDVNFMRALRSVSIPLFSADYHKLGPADGERVASDFIRVFAQISDAMLDDLVELARRWQPDLIVYEPNAYAGPIAAAAIGVPTVRIPWGPDITSMSAELDLSLLRPLLNRYGLATVNTLGTLTADPCPPSMQIESDIPRRTMRYVPFNGPGAVPAWLLEPTRRPRACVTWGTSTVQLAGPDAFLLPYALRAVRRRVADVVVAITEDQAELLGEVPEGVRVVHGVPLQALLPTCDVVVHQGGAGTTLTAASYGVPQAIIPQVPDQVLNALQLMRTGAGVVCFPRGQLGEAALPDIDAVLGKVIGELDQYAEAAGRLRVEIEAQPAPTEVVADLVELARQAG